MYNNVLSVVLFILAVAYATILEYFPEYIPTLIGTFISLFYDIDYQFYLVRIEYYVYGIIVVIISVRALKKRGKITYEMKQILKTMFNTNKGEMNIEQIVDMLQIPQQQARYYVDELKKEKLIKFAALGSGYYYLTPEGRAYVMEKLMKKSLIREWFKRLVQ